MEEWAPDGHLHGATVELQLLYGNKWTMGVTGCICMLNHTTAIGPAGGAVAEHCSFGLFLPAAASCSDT